jgi:hypothetical protein
VADAGKVIVYWMQKAKGQAAEPAGRTLYEQKSVDLALFPCTGPDRRLRQDRPEFCCRGDSKGRRDRRGNIRRRDMYFFDYSSTYQFCLIKPKLNSNIEKESFQNLSSFIFDNNNSLNDLLFISGKGPLFEKRLGEGESMILSEKNILAFEGSITFEMIPKKQKLE